MASPHVGPVESSDPPKRGASKPAIRGGVKLPQRLPDGAATPSACCNTKVVVSPDSIPIEAECIAAEKQRWYAPEQAAST